MDKTKIPILYQLAQKDQWKTVDGEVIVEAPISLTVNGEYWLTFMCTPANLEALALGFLYNEGFVRTKDEIELVRVCDSGDNVDVWLNHSVEQPKHWRRTSGCSGGVTAVEEYAPPLRNINGLTIHRKEVGKLVGMLFASQHLYRTAGGVHTSALSDRKRILISAEDIGRHNSLDKIAGRLLLDNLKLTSRILLTTGRISSEMLQKSHRMGASIVISCTSPTSMSVSQSKKLGITLIGYAKRSRFKVYTFPGRIL